MKRILAVAMFAVAFVCVGVFSRGLSCAPLPQRSGTVSVEFETTDVVLGTTFADSASHVVTLPATKAPAFVTIEVENTGAVSFTNLGIQELSHSSGTWTTVFSGTDWADSAIGSIIWCSSSTASTLAASGKVEIWLVVNSPCRLRVVASSASAGEMAVRGTVAYPN